MGSRSPVKGQDKIRPPHNHRCPGLFDGERVHRVRLPWLPGDLELQRNCAQATSRDPGPHSTSPACVKDRPSRSRYPAPTRASHTGSRPRRCLPRGHPAREARPTAASVVGVQGPRDIQSTQGRGMQYRLTILTLPAGQVYWLDPHRLLHLFQLPQAGVGSAVRSDQPVDTEIAVVGLVAKVATVGEPPFSVCATGAAPGPPSPRQSHPAAVCGFDASQ